ncbi:MAG: MAPEG family protein [Spirulina sp. SIO3F2]|nr:MAPEG family protein [Spirulina sp. SIO3F2]
MTSDLIALLILALWTLFLNHLPALARVQVAGVQWALSNREDKPTTPAWVERADRAQRNHLDNLALIATVVLMAHVIGRNDVVTAIAAGVITSSRIAHSLFYLAGQPLLRSSSYFVSVLGLGMIVIHLWI